MDLGAEFDRQLATLVGRGYPALAGVTAQDFSAAAELLRPAALAADPDAAIPFVLVATGVPAARAAERIERHGKPADVSMFAGDDLARFVPIDAVAVPDGPLHLILDVDLGAATHNVTPNAALDAIAADGRSVLTVEEGIALVTHFPDAVAPNAGFSLVGSRCGDKRVAALWISRRAPKLGWCWAGNPHTWLGSASCAGRAGAGAQAPSAWASAHAIASP